MKKLPLILLAGFFFATAHAQLAFGVKAGAGISNVDGSDVSGTRPLVGFNAGAYLKIPWTRQLSIQPEADYSGQGFKETTGGIEATQHEGYIDVPILVKYTHSTGVFVETGPQAGFLVSAKVSSQGVSVSDKGSLNPAEFAWIIGAGVKIPMTAISIDARYIFGLSNILNTSQTPDNGSTHNGTFQIGIMVHLFSAKKVFFLLPS